MLYDASLILKLLEANRHRIQNTKIVQFIDNFRFGFWLLCTQLHILYILSLSFDPLLLNGWWWWQCVDNILSTMPSHRL